MSRAANIPTVWEITLNLIQKLAVLCEENYESDPEGWYQDTFETEPDHPELLDQLAKTPTERQQVLRVYWEPTDTEREDVDKQPSIAHRSIAALAARGLKRITITTHFDRLMETALRDEGIEPTVLTTPNQVQGALPLIHTKCFDFEVHGDCLDTRIRNTRAELDSYPPAFNRFLDRILDEFGLIVCGWSAGWDSALRTAIESVVRMGGGSNAGNHTPAAEFNAYADPEALAALLTRPVPITMIELETCRKLHFDEAGLRPLVRKLERNAVLPGT